MESRVRSLEARRLRAAGMALRAGSSGSEAFLHDGPWSLQLLHCEVIDCIARYLSGATSRRELHRKTVKLIRERRPQSGQPDMLPPAMTALGLAALLSAPSLSLDAQELGRCLRYVLSAIGCRRPLPVGKLLRSVADSSGQLDLSVQETPCALYDESAIEILVQWADLAIDAPVAGFRLIPLSIFTRDFFRDTVLGGGDHTTDLSRYHRENNKAPGLREKYPELTESLPFQYYVDESGLSEIVLDTRHLGWGEQFLAARLFALYSGLECAALEGIPLLKRC